MRAMFSRHGMRHTPQREAVYRALASTTMHPSAEELHALVRKSRPKLSLATVYNTLETMERRGLCRRFACGATGPARYDAEMHNHVHVTTEDGRIRDVPAETSAALLGAIPAELLEAIEERLGVRVDGVRLELVGRAVDPGRC